MRRWPKYLVNIHFLDDGTVVSGLARSGREFSSESERIHVETKEIGSLFVIVGKKVLKMMRKFGVLGYCNRKRGGQTISQCPENKCAVGLLALFVHEGLFGLVKTYWLQVVR